VHHSVQDADDLMRATEAIANALGMAATVPSGAPAALEHIQPFTEAALAHLAA